MSIAVTPYHSVVTTRRAERVRLTRRGRLAIFLTVLAVIMAGLLLLAGPATSTSTTHHAPTRSVVVGPGETLWDIAGRVAPGEDPRSVIAEIVQLNALTDAGSVRVGQQLDVPAT